MTVTVNKETILKNIFKNFYDLIVAISGFSTIVWPTYPDNVLNAKGVFVETTAKHLCICGRGPKDDNSETTVTYGCGTLKKWYLCKT